MSRKFAIALFILTVHTAHAPAEGITGHNVVVLLRLIGNGALVPQMRSCLASKLLQMPDIEVALAPRSGVRFVVDVIVAKAAARKVSASLVVAETFPIEQFRPRFKEGEDSDALIASIDYYTLLRLHEVMADRSRQTLCARIAAEIGDKVLSKEYTERND